MILREFMSKTGYHSFFLKSENDLKSVRDSNSVLNILTFRLSNIRELDNVKYAYTLQFWTNLVCPFNLVLIFAVR